MGPYDYSISLRVYSAVFLRIPVHCKVHRALPFPGTLQHTFPSLTEVLLIYLRITIGSHYGIIPIGVSSLFSLSGESILDLAQVVLLEDLIIIVLHENHIPIETSISVSVRLKIGDASIILRGVFSIGIQAHPVNIELRMLELRNVPAEVKISVLIRRRIRKVAWRILGVPGV